MKTVCSVSERFTQSVSTGPGPQRVPGRTVSMKLHAEVAATINSHTAFTEYAMFERNCNMLCSTNFHQSLN